MKSSHRWYANPWLHAGLILLVAAFFRLWQFDEIPPGLFGDEAQDGLDALDVLAGRGAVFFPANFGREGLHMWIVAGMFRLLGVEPLAVRLPSALAGTLTALATYWLGRELLASSRRGGDGDGSRGGAWIPLFAALYVATSFWHVHFSRFGIRGVFTPLLGALAFAAFWRAVNRGSYGWFAAAGAFLGLATHFYTASRFFPFFLGGFLLVQWLVARLAGRAEHAILPRHFKGILLLYGVAALVFSPLAGYFLAHPGSFTQRAGEVAAFGSQSAWLTMAKAAAANVLQFVVPGGGDAERFYNLPGRAVFEPLTAVLAILGLGLLLFRWRREGALFLLLWFPALLLPSFLATDRWPTLPRVLGVIPGVYFFPAVGLAGVIALVAAAGAGLGRPRLAAVTGVLIAVIALGAHAAATYRDYFRTWGPSAATFDAFEGDMTSAWRWLRENSVSGHVYLSSDIYRHPTFMLLSERATVQTYFEHANPALSWFDAREALPLPPEGESATYVVAASSTLVPAADAWLRGAGRVVDVVAAPDGQPALTVIALEGAPSAGPLAANQDPPAQIDGNLALSGASVTRDEDGVYRLWLRWDTGDRDPLGWPAYRLELQAENGSQWSATAPFEGFRPPEWVLGGGFITWHRLEGLDGAPGRAPASVRLRLIDRRDDQPVTGADAADGWHTVRIPQ